MDISIFETNNHILLITAIVLIFGASISYILFERKIISPTFVSSVVFAIGCILAYIGNKKWVMPITWKIFDILIIGIAGMFVGEYLCRCIIQQRRDRISRTTEKYIIAVPLSYVAVLFVISMIAMLAYYIRLCQIAGVGYSNIFGLLESINHSRHSSDQRIGLHIAGLNIVKNCSWTFLTYAYINNILVQKREAAKKYRYYLILWIPYILSIIAGGSRIGFVTMMSNVLMGYIFLNLRYNGTRVVKTFKQIFKYLFIGMVLLLLVFSFMGTLSGKINENNTPLDSFLIYTASSIVDLNVYLEKGLIRSNFPGSNTFLAFVNLIGRFFTLPGFNDVGTGYIRLSTGTITNVYTAFAGYLIDFGFLGMLILQFMLGILYTALGEYVVEKPRISFTLICYICSFYYGLVGQLFAPETVAGMFGVNDLCAIAVYFVVFHLFYEKHFKEVYVDET